MIDFRFRIYNPFKDQYKSLKDFDILLTKNFSFDFEIVNTNDIILIGLKLNFKEDHWGIRILLGVFGYTINTGVYNIQHCD